jgi:hypothetical protein
MEYVCSYILMLQLVVGFEVIEVEIKDEIMGELVEVSELNVPLLDVVERLELVELVTALADVREFVLDDNVSTYNEDVVEHNRELIDNDAVDVILLELAVEL